MHNRTPITPRPMRLVSSGTGIFRSNRAFQPPPPYGHELVCAIRANAEILKRAKRRSKLSTRILRIALIVGSPCILCLRLVIGETPLLSRRLCSARWTSQKGSPVDPSAHAHTAPKDDYAAAKTGAAPGPWQLHPPRRSLLVMSSPGGGENLGLSERCK